MRPRTQDPSYRLHKQSGQAVVTLRDGQGGRRDVLLGEYSADENHPSHAEYQRVLDAWKAAGRRWPPPQPEADGPPDVRLNELMVAYWRFAEGYYVKDGKPTSEQDDLRFLKQLYGHTPAREFRPRHLKAVREAMIAHPITVKVKVKDPATGEVREEAKVLRRGYTRKVINKHVGRIKRLFAWRGGWGDGRTGRGP